MNLDVRTLADASELARAAAEEISLRARQAREQGRPFTLALAGGTTPARAYQVLAAEPYRSAISWDAVHVFWSDERAVAPDDPSSNYGLAERELLRHVQIPRQNVHRAPADAPDLVAACREYERQIARVVPQSQTGAVPEFDLVLLGLGTDGHTASLFPGDQAALASEQWVTIGHAPVAPHVRLTFTLPLLMAARCVLFLVSGKEKAAIFARISGVPSEQPLPARLVSERARSCLWFVEREVVAHQ